MTKPRPATDGIDAPNVTSLIPASQEPPVTEEAPAAPVDAKAPATVPASPPAEHTGPMIVLSPHVPVAASLENTMSQSLITIRQAINDETAAMHGEQDATKKKVEAITAKARREIQELEDTQAEADAAHIKRLEDLRVAEDMLAKGLEPAERARAARVAKEQARQEQSDDQQS